MDAGTRTDHGELPRKEHEPAWLDVVREQVTSLKFGSVEITVHDSRVVQVQKIEKLRLDRLS